MQRIECRIAALFAVAALCIAGCSADGDSGDSRSPSRGGAAGTGSPRTPSGGAAVSGGAGTSGTLGPGWSGQQPGIMPIAGAPATTPGNTMLPQGTCASGLADTAPVTPVIWLVVDGSSSMNQDFEGGANRWDTLRSTLMNKGGIVDSLQAVAKFGMVIYSGGASDPMQCVQLVTVQPALNNFAALEAAYPMQPLGMGTPTDKALEHVVTNLPVVNKAMLDTRNEPIYVVLATDGQPNDNCGGGGILGGGGRGDDATVRQRVIEVVTRGTMAGMNMFVISMAGGDNQLQAHLDQVAMATLTKTPPFVPASQNDLVKTFRDIVGSASCQVDLKGMVKQGSECAGKVTLNGTELACDNDNGWRLLDPDTFELTGKACTDFTSVASTVSAMFPCDVFRPE
ncbi:MAG TPA: vWA domain-containing protein [Polyangiales bacterium]|nr:vWA domain-containing protein [Polyangiales bacterium]